MPNPVEGFRGPFKAANQVGAAVITVGAEAGNIINVAVSLRDARYQALAVRGSVHAYLSNDATGDSLITTAPSSGVAIGTNGLAIALVAGKCFLLTSESDGSIDLNLSEAGALTCYLILVMPDGTLKASGVITFV
jgi:hypothetical protein